MELVLNGEEVISEFLSIILSFLPSGPVPKERPNYWPPAKLMRDKDNMAEGATRTYNQGPSTVGTFTWYLLLSTTSKIIR